MEFCIISPTSGLERYATLSETHLVLTHQWKRGPRYREFYHKRQNEGDFIILDNGAYEGYTYFEDLVRIANEVRPNVLTLPDYYLRPWKETWHAATAWLDRFATGLVLPKCEFCYIPQSNPGDYHGFVESYLRAVEDPRITWLGIPRCLATDIARDPLARVSFARLVRNERPDLHLHCFGMVNGDVHELPYLSAAGVRSIDSSAPVWRGWRGLRVNDKLDREAWDMEGTPVDFSSTELFQPQVLEKGRVVNAHEIILDNLEACGVDTRRGSGSERQDNASGAPDQSRFDVI